MYVGRFCYFYSLDIIYFPYCYRSRYMGKKHQEDVVMKENIHEKVHLVKDAIGGRLARRKSG